MTLKVAIYHSTPGYSKRAKITPITPDGTPQGYPDHIETYQKIVGDGEVAEFYVHDGISLKVEEIDVAPVEAVK